MAQVERGQLEQLRSAIDTQEHLRRMRESLEHYHRLVFHANASVNWTLVRESAEQILMAEIISRHHGDPDGVYQALRGMEAEGKSWPVAISELSGRIHSYYTTPLGVVLRKDLFGDDAVFITPEAHEWIRRQRNTTQSEVS